MDWTSKPSLDAFDDWCLAWSTRSDAFERARRSIPDADWRLFDARVSPRLFGVMPGPIDPQAPGAGEGPPSTAALAMRWYAKQDAFVAERRRRGRMSPGP